MGMVMIVSSALGCVAGNGLYSYTRSIIPTVVLGDVRADRALLPAAFAFLGVPCSDWGPA